MAKILLLVVLALLSVGAGMYGVYVLTPERPPRPQPQPVPDRERLAKMLVWANITIPDEAQLLHFEEKSSRDVVVYAELAISEEAMTEFKSEVLHPERERHSSVRVHEDDGGRWWPRRSGHPAWWNQAVVHAPEVLVVDDGYGTYTALIFSPETEIVLVEVVR